MPTLTLKIAPPLGDPAQAQPLAAALTRVSAETLGKRAEVTAVVIEAVALTHWSVGGRPAQRPTAMLDIDITAGTNTAAEKARFIAAAFDTIERALAPQVGLEPASYVLVREWPATDWGYDGRTQAERRIEREMA
jgi:4-oxalocrotonate tautomerase